MTNDYRCFVKSKSGEECGSIACEDGLCWYHRDAKKYQDDLAVLRELTTLFAIDGVKHKAILIKPELFKMNGWAQDKYGFCGNKFFPNSTRSTLPIEIGDWLVEGPEGRQRFSDPDFKSLLEKPNVKVLQESKVLLGENK